MSTQKKPDMHSDLTDSERDKARMQPEETTMDMPDAEEIPGQEHIHVPRMREFQDTTISSDDEEGKNVFAEEEELDDQDTDVTPEEIELLSRTDISMSGIDDEDRRKLMLDKTDFDGELLNEKDNISGEDLDVPGADEDDADEEIGEEDEENNSYSLGGDRKD
jgi:hypothetical protein